MHNFLYTSCQVRSLDRVVTSKANTVYSYLCYEALIFMMTGGQGSWQAVGFTRLLRDCSDIRDGNYRKYCLLYLALKCMITSVLFRADHNVMLILENLIDC